jgi:ComEC/Rec2-related protein
MQPRRELTWSDVPALGFAAAGICGAAVALLLNVSPGSLFVFVALATPASLAALALSKNRPFAIGFAYVTLTAIVCFRGSLDVARDEREFFVTHTSDTAIVQCRGVVVWKDEAGAEGRTSRLLLSDLRVIFPDTTAAFAHTQLRLSLPVHAGQLAEIGDVIACEAKVVSASEYQQSSIRELCWTLRDRLIGTARLINEESLVVVQGGYSIRRWFYDVRNAFFDVFEEYLRPDARAVAGALLLGSRTAFSPDFRQDLQTTGLAHLFALSGLNTGLLVSLLWLLLGWLRVPRKPRYILLLALLALYTGLGLGVPSLLRSSMMAGLMILSRLLARPSHPVNLLLFAAGVELLIWPLHILDAGFHLSYLSMAGIIAAYLALHEPFQDLIQIKNQSLASKTVDTLSSTLGAQLATSPAVALMFGRVPGLAILINVVAIPIFSLLLVLLLVLLILSQISSYLATAASRAIEALVSLFAALTGSAASLIGSSFTSQQAWYWTVGAIAMQLFAIVTAYVGKRAAALVMSLIAINLLLWPSHFESVDDIRIVSLGDRSSESYFVHFFDLNILLGCGPEWMDERRADQVSDELQRVNVQKLDALVVLDRMAQNIGAAPRIIEVVNPEMTLDFSSARDTKTSERLDAACLLYGVELATAELGQVWRDGDSKMTVTRFDHAIVILKIERDKRCLLMEYSVDGSGADRKWSFSTCDGSNESLNFTNAVRDWSLENTKWVSNPPKASELMSIFSLPRGSEAL